MLISCLNNRKHIINFMAEGKKRLKFINFQSKSIGNLKLLKEEIKKSKRKAVTMCLITQMQMTNKMMSIVPWMLEKNVLYIKIKITSLTKVSSIENKNMGTVFKSILKVTSTNNTEGYLNIICFIGKASLL